eukprot:366028-Chlamydomonas_euryale.AAC.20
MRIYCQPPTAAQCTEGTWNMHAVILHFRWLATSTHTSSEFDGRYHGLSSVEIGTEQAPSIVCHPGKVLIVPICAVMLVHGVAAEPTAANALVASETAGPSWLQHGCYFQDC